MVLKGEHPPHTGNVLLKRAIFVLFAWGFERFGYYSLVGSITTFFTRELHFTAVFASQMQAIFSALLYILPIVGAVMSDLWFGRWNMTIFSYGGYAIGSLCLVFAAYYKIDWLTLLCYYCLIAIPAAFIKPNLITLGADQFDPRKPDQLKQRSTFFAGQYWTTNVAATVCFLVIADIAYDGMGAITRDFGFTFTFIIGTICLALGFITLMIGMKKFWAPVPVGSPLNLFFRITGAAVKKKEGFKTNWMGINTLISCVGIVVSILLAIPTFFVEEPVLNYVVSAFIIISTIMLIWYGQDANWVLQAELRSPGKFSAEEIDGVRAVYTLCPYIGFAIPFWAVYNQLNTSFITQGCQMQYVINGESYAPQTLSAYNSLIIVLLIPVFNFGIYPLCQKCGGGKYTLTPLRRWGVGLFVAACGMASAGILEYFRRDAPIAKVVCTQDEVDLFWCTTDQIGTMVDQLSICYDYDPSGNSSEPSPVHDINLYYQIIVYGIVGISEILTAITIWDLFYSQVPSYMKAVCQAIQLLTTSLGSLVSGVINSISIGWLPNNLDRGHQEYMYFINMGIALIALVFFIFVSQNFVYIPGTSLFPWDDKDDANLALLAKKKEEKICHLEGAIAPKSDEDDSITEYYYSEMEDIHTRKDEY